MMVQHYAIDTNAVDYDGISVLQYAVTVDNYNVTKMLLDQQDLVIINQRDHNGWTPLFQAINCEAKKCLPLLLANSQLDLDMRENLDMRAGPMDQREIAR